VASKNKDRETAGAPVLPRLPPGRHGLSREYVTRNQRDRLAAGTIASIADRGYHETTISHISKAAGVSRRTFYAYFSSKEECYRSTYDLIAAHLVEAAREAADEKSEWSEKVTAKWRSTLEAFQANPDLARYVLVSPLRAGEEPLERYQQGLEKAVAELSDGMPDEIGRPSKGVELALLSGILRLLATEASAGDGDRLKSMLPEMAQLYLMPYLGHAEAKSAAARA
jgi:AcrR family transcriptional regulator